MIRRTMARYLLLLQTLTCQAVSTSVRKRFPTLEHVEEAGIITKEERLVYEQVPGVHGKWWVPAQWFSALAIRARKEGRIKDDILLYQLLEELHIFRGCCGMMFAYDWISIPLVYTQTVTIATYTYFLATLMGRQYLDPRKGYKGHEVDLYIPVFTVLEFFFFMGWLKVAEQLINAYGEDDDDFELNWCLDRNLLISNWIVDDGYNKYPRLERDLYWDESEPVLPYTKSSFLLRTTSPHLGSAMNLNVNLGESEFVPLETIMEDQNEAMYKSEPASPGCGGEEGRFSADSQSAEQQTTRHEAISTNSKRTSVSDSRGSRFFNLINGQSCENVSRDTSHKSTHNLIRPFMLKTPQKRQQRTTSMADKIDVHTPHFPLNRQLMKTTSTHHMGNDFFQATPNKKKFNEPPTAPVILNSEHISPLVLKKDSRSTSVAHGEFFNENNHEESKPHEMVGESGFHYPPNGLIKPYNQSAYFPYHITRDFDDPISSSTLSVNRGSLNAPTIWPSPAVLTQNNSSINSTIDISNDLMKDDLLKDERTNDEKDSATVDDFEKFADEDKDSIILYQSSQESISPLESNQSTVNSFTELLKKD